MRVCEAPNKLKSGIISYLESVSDPNLKIGCTDHRRQKTNTDYLIFPVSLTFTFAYVQLNEHIESFHTFSSTEFQKVTFIKPTTGYLRFSLILDDPCPYGMGARAELSDLVVRYRQAQKDKDTGSQIGVGDWSEAEVCRLTNLITSDTNTASTEKSEVAQPGDGSRRTDQQGQEVEENEQTGIAWSGNRPLTCEFPVADTQKNYEVCWKICSTLHSILKFSTVIDCHSHSH